MATNLINSLQWPCIKTGAKLIEAKIYNMQESRCHTMLLAWHVEWPIHCLMVDFDEKIMHEIEWLINYWFVFQSCVSPDGQEAWDKNTKLYTSDCSKECTCVGEGEYFCEDLCPVQIAHCNVGYVARFKTIKISKRGRECRCDGKRLSWISSNLQ